MQSFRLNSKNKFLLKGRTYGEYYKRNEKMDSINISQFSILARICMLACTYSGHTFSYDRTITKKEGMLRAIVCRLTNPKDGLNKAGQYFVLLLFGFET